MKKTETILISIASSAAFRNLFLFPGSFLDYLKQAMRSGDLSVVFVVTKQYDAKYREFLNQALAEVKDYWTIEVIKVPTPRGFLQRFFYFCYSYLIFTGTTMIMATIGTRPDEPPAGGRGYLSPIKGFISLSLGKSAYVKQKLVPALFQSIFKNIRSFAPVFDKYQPVKIFATHIYGWFDMILISEAKRRNIKTVGMPAGWDHLDKYFLPLKVDRLVVQSQQIKDMAVDYQGYNPESIEIVGYPHFDFIWKREFLQPREKILETLNFPTNAKFILYISGSAYCPDEPEIIETMIKWADENKFGTDVRFVIRPYLGGRSKDREFDEEKFNRFENNPRVYFYRREFWGDIPKTEHFLNIINSADAVISVYSTAVLEAAVLDRPIVAPLFDGYQIRPFRRSITRFAKFDHFKSVLETGALRTPKSFKELFADLDKYLRDPAADSDKRRLLRENVCGPLDGHSSERVFRALSK
ncbi:MAG: CDP-glycerol glycerophosphotransferase family protein [Candidatus Paceibacterota bacterium]|jgi:hypothetical protein